MAFRPDRARALTIGLTLRAVALSLLVIAIVELLPTGRYYATSLLLAIVAAVVVADLARRAARSIEARDPAPTGADPVRRQQREERLQALLDTVSAALLVLHADDRVELANRAARVLAGREADRLEHLEALGPEAAVQLRELAHGGHRVLRIANGQRMLASAASFEVPGEPGARLVSLQRVAAELGAVELAAWDDMTRVLAHEMMNSLTPIASLSESLESQLRGSDAPGEAAESLEAIRRRSRGLMEFVDRYRRLAERPRPQPAPLALADLVTGIERLMSASFRERGVTYRGLVTPLTLAIDADRQLLEQALLNLLRNALDAVASAPQPLIEVTCRASAERIEICVADNGPGLDAEERERIFIPFYTTKAGGSGIGLSLVRYVALAHGGQLDVDAVLPRGTRFTLRLPR